MADTVARAVVALAEAFGRKASETTVETYRVGLQGLSAADIEKATSLALQQCEFMPPPAVLRRLAGNGTASLEDKAISAWSDVERAFPVGSYKWVDFDDSTINATIRHLGGWPEMFERCGTVDGEKWYRLEFLKVYKSLDAAGVSEEARRPLPGLSEAGRIVMVDGKPMAVEPTPKRIMCSENRRKEREQCKPKLIPVRSLIQSAISGGRSNESQAATSAGESTAISRSTSATG